ncbi:MAG: hypothetical protein NTZ80_01055 [Patescibacteria group bacterium]|nr:hypothetical protein [Patescibacteria group bacterium]
MPTCPKCQSSFEITPEDLVFYDKISPIFNGKKFQIPSPTLCPSCRIQRRLGYRNQQNFYQRLDDFSKTNIVSLYSPNKPYKVFNDKIFWSDKWSPLEYGQDFNFNDSFFNQFRQLQINVPRSSMHQDLTNENCEYTTFSAQSHNCYLSSGFNSCENIYYSAWQVLLKDSVDCLKCTKSELLYECMDCQNCYHCLFSQNCVNCDHSYFLEDCIGCSRCIGCKNLRNKKNYIFNKPSQSEEVDKFISNLGSYKCLLETKELSDKHRKKLPSLYAHLQKTENCSGDRLENAKNCQQCFDGIVDAEDCHYCQIFGWDARDLGDCTLATKNSELLYENLAIMEVYNSAFINFCSRCNNIFYCDNLASCEHCFGCIGLRNAKYCILNKQYSKEDYDSLTSRIIPHMQKLNEWGEFFPISISPFGYNETVAQELFPLTEDEAIQKGFDWCSYKSPQPKFTKTLSADQLEKFDDIQSVPDDITKFALKCEISGNLFQIQKPELKFYQQMNIRLPRRCPKIRHLDRLHRRQPWKLWHRVCDRSGCSIEFDTAYAPEDGEIVYCEKCYLESVY